MVTDFERARRKAGLGFGQLDLGQRTSAECERCVRGKSHLLRTHLTHTCGRPDYKHTTKVVHGACQRCANPKLRKRHTCERSADTALERNSVAKANRDQSRALERRWAELETVAEAVAAREAREAEKEAAAAVRREAGEATKRREVAEARARRLLAREQAQALQQAQDDQWSEGEGGDSAGKAEGEEQADRAAEQAAETVPKPRTKSRGCLGRLDYKSTRPRTADDARRQYARLHADLPVPLTAEALALQCGDRAARHHRACEGDP
jgi:hypothetical protein